MIGKRSTLTKTVEQEVLRVKKHDETRREYMTLAMELKQQRKEGRTDEKKDMILRLSGMEMSIEFIAKATATSPEFIEKVLSEKPAVSSRP